MGDKHFYTKGRESLYVGIGDGDEEIAGGENFQGPVATIPRFTTLKSYLRNIEAYTFFGTPSGCGQYLRLTNLKSFLWEGVTKKTV